jgi:uncharacterized membrane protein
MHRQTTTERIMPFTPIILIHVLAAFGALAIGGITFFLKKGTLTHRLFGRVWVALMMTTAFVSFAIKSSGQFSWIHVLSVIAIAGVGISILAAVRGKIRTHQRGMTATYASLVIAGMFTLLPGRILGDLVWHSVGLT